MNEHETNGKSTLTGLLAVRVSTPRADLTALCAPPDGLPGLHCWTDGKGAFWLSEHGPGLAVGRVVRLQGQVR